MNDARILQSGMSRLHAHRVKRELGSAMVAGQAITSHSKRKINRIAWEGDRSPSKLGRAGERAQQVHDVVAPSMLTAIAIIGAAKAAVELLAAYRDYKRTDKDEEPPEPTKPEDTERPSMPTGAKAE